jgi:transposase/predicted nucleic acid-binding Zn finger protein
MQLQELLQIRKQRGIQIAKTKKVVKEGYKWIVPSQSSNRNYEVVLKIDKSTCTCPDFIERGIKCKHIFAVEITITKTMNQDGTATVTKRITYSQDWPNYTKAQVEEGHLFRTLLKDLVENVPEEPYRFGRPSIPKRTAIFCAIDKVYSMQSSRRAHSRYEDAQEKQQIDKAPNYNHINKTLESMEITPILTDLLHITAAPLKGIETKFSTDSTGFRTSRFSDYCEKKHNTKKVHKWIKCHAMTGNTTNIITDAIITNEDTNDCPQLIPLLNHTVDAGFSISELSADKAYSSMDNYNAINAIRGTPYIPFKSNTSGTITSGSRGKLWRRAFHYFQLHQDEFLEHYHNRSNVETTFFAVKAKFGDSVKNKTFVSQTNEVLCKLIAYNITVLISAMYELKIEPKLLQ